MTFELKTQSNPPTTGRSVHKLERGAFWQWWQMSQAFSLRPKRTNDPFKNDALRASLVFLLSCPIHLAFLVHTALPAAVAEHREFALFKLWAMTVLVWLSQLWLFCLAGRRQLRIAQEVITTEDGLEVRSPFFKRKIHWSEINDVFRVGNKEAGYDMFEVDCNNGEWILLSEKLSDCESLISLIEKKLPRNKRPAYEFNYRISDGLFDAANLATWAIFIAIAFGPVNAGRLPTLPEFAMITVLSIVALANRWMWAHKIPQLVRVGQSEIYLRTRSQSQLIAWDQVKAIKKLGSLHIIKTRTKWFVVLLSKNEPVNEKLMECRTKLLLEQQRVIT